MEKIKNFLVDEEGQGMTEYIIIVALIAIGCIAAYKVFGEKIDEFLEYLGGKMGDAKR